MLTRKYRSFFKMNDNKNKDLFLKDVFHELENLMRLLQ